MQNYEKLFGFHEETQGKDRQVSMLLHDIMVWNLLIAIKGQWIQAQRKKDEEGFKQKWGKSSLIQIDDCQEVALDFEEAKNT
ncbi:uncharacterized protein VTP21DRAFT_6531 [Calcarisporiella thermophila]|uniref:uncharacterized protein n=1 Tax=Calcarisporiella thermophila TaxID=911321 RepID=UPI00374352D9